MPPSSRISSAAGFFGDGSSHCICGHLVECCRIKMTIVRLDDGKHIACCACRVPTQYHRSRVRLHTLYG